MSTSKLRHGPSEPVFEDDRVLLPKTTPNSSYRSLQEERGYAERTERIAGKERYARGYECNYPDSEASVIRFDRLAWYGTDAKNSLVPMVTEKDNPQWYLTWSLFSSWIKATAKAMATKR